MSLDHLSSSNLAESLMETKNNPIFYTHHPQLPSSDLGNLNLNPQNDSHQPEQVFINTRITTIVAKEAMFQKTLTQSDVGKLNRLVLPKHHAEKYFPLLPRDGGASRQQKGVLLTFEDECGKLWHFRYLYWKSSKSYVLTKGWKFYVHEKRLEAGDILFFERYNCERTFIGWKRRSAAAALINERIVREVAQPIEAQPIDGGAQINRWSKMFHHAHSGYPSHHSAVSIPLHADNGEAGGEYENVVNYQTGVGATRQLRLFGVDLECPNNSETHAGHPDYQHRLLFQQSSWRHG